jgi:cellulose synthase (UDP-forming)
MPIRGPATVPQHDRRRPPDPNHANSGKSFLRSYDYPVYGFLTGVRLIVLGYAVHWFYCHLADGRFIPDALLSVPLLLPGIFDQLIWFSLLVARRTESHYAPRGLRVAAVTTFEPQSESLDMLEQTVVGLTAMVYDHETWVLDEGDEPRVRELCRRMGARHFSRKGDPRFQSDNGQFEAGTKHGNYNSWLQRFGFEQFDFVAAFDPDHIPQPQFLDSVLGHFDDGRVGYVQAPQAYYNQPASFVAQGAAEETYGYYSIVQAAASRFGYPVVTGCHTTHRISALQQIGGFAQHPADDVLNTANYHRGGWRGIYVTEILARGLAPFSWRSYVDQQRRWARSLLDLKLRHSISPRPANAMIQTLQGIRYFLDGMFSISLIALVMLMLAGTPLALPALGVTAEVCSVLLLTNLYKQRFYLDSTTECGLPWRSYLLRYVKAPYTFAALFDVVRNRKPPYNITRKDGTGGRQPTVMLPQLVVTLALTLAWGISSLTGQITNPAVHLVAAFAVAVHLAISVTDRTRFPGPYDPRVSPPAPGCRILSGLELLIGFLLAISFLLWPLRLIKGTVVLSDSARHLMNGVFVYDLFRTGNIFHPIAFARWYFAHFLSLSMPYHPPLFPACEALLFTIFGLKFGVARLAIAATVSLSAYLLYRLVLINSGSALIGVATCASFLFLEMSRYLEEDIMLEFPALVFVLAAMLSLQKAERDGFSWRQGFSFGIWAAAGIWTKQTIFAALVPFIYFGLMRSRRPFGRPGIWVATAISTASAMLLLAISAKVGLWGVPHNWVPISASQALIHNTKFYMQRIPTSMLLLPAVLAAACAVSRRALGDHGSPARWAYLYISWAVSAVIIVLVAPAYEPRYLFFALPPLLALSCESVYRLLRTVFASGTAAAWIAVGAAIFCGLHVSKTPIWLTGPETAAERLNAAGVGSAVFLGKTDGAFIFSTRLGHPDLQAVVFRGDKVFEGNPDRKRLEEFAHNYGANAVVLESLRGKDLDWPLILHDSKTLKYWFRQEIESSFPYLRGSLFVFHVSNPSLMPERSIRERIEVFGRDEIFRR